MRLGVIIVSGALLITAVTIGIAPRLWRIANAHSEEPVPLPDFIPLSQRSYVYDAAGNEIAVYELENIQPVSFGDIPEHVIQAFVAVEDNEFWVHHGVNARSFIRALLSNSRPMLLAKGLQRSLCKSSRMISWLGLSATVVTNCYN